ncbi:MAG: diacylglycerol kinase family lipid kinase [Candidatus Acetothermia bacterium]|jgi:YegS/Rv2252/BmrU family lipid kinase|nr:diacylglycerol kinase family lipid kinase [Candidatus Acetothermia bacterium]
MNQAFVILNPAADRGRAGTRETELRNALDQMGLKATIVRTERPGHGAELARAAVAWGASLVVAAGGDGTINEVAQGLVGTTVPLGILPMGSGNDYIRVMGIPKDLSAAAALLAKGHVRTVDVAEAADRFYLNSFGMGIEGQIAADYRRMRILKGEIGYLYATILEVVRFRSFHAEVQGDGWAFSGKLLSVSVMNGPYAGGGFRLAPQAAIDDGTVDVGLIGNYPRLVRFWVLPKTRDGSYLKLARVQARKAQRISIRSDRPLPVHMDGELLPERVRDLEVALRPAALRVVA